MERRVLLIVLKVYNHFYLDYQCDTFLPNKFYGTIMKVLIFLFTLMISQQVFACTCKTASPLFKVARSDFIATVNILNVTPDIENKHMKDVEIEILDLFKGDKISILKTYSTINGNSCGVYTSKGATWLIFAYKNNDDELIYDLCSGSKNLDKTSNFYNQPNAKAVYKSSLNSNIELLEYLKDEDIKLNDNFGLRTFISEECLKGYNGIDPGKRTFALYEITIDSLSNIKMINAVKEFENKALKSDLLSCLNKSVTISKDDEKMDVPKNTKIMVALFYNPARDINKSFINSGFRF